MTVAKISYTKLYLSILLLLALAKLSNINLPNDYLVIALALAVAVLGLPHGALDFAVAKSLSLFSSSRSALVFLIGYVAIATLSIIFWLNFPSVALTIFLSVSVYHFSADWRAFMPKHARVSLAVIIICGPTLVYSSVVIDLFIVLLVSAESATFIVEAMKLMFTISLLSFGYFLARLLNKKNIVSKVEWWILAESIALLISSLTLTPLLHFGLYFCLLHSPNHMHDVSKNLNIDMSKAMMRSLPFVMLTLVLAVGVYGWTSAHNYSIEPGSALLRWVFIGLFGLTMSHMILIDFWHRRK